MEAVSEYVGLAREVGITPTELAIRFVLSHPLVASAAIGATTIDQLRELIDARVAGPLDSSIMERIDETHARMPNPTP